MFVNVVAPINQLGYGVVGYNVLKALYDLGHQVSYFPISQPQWEGPAPFVQKLADNAKTFNAEAPSIRIWHQNEMAMFPGKGPRIGWPIFELNRFTMLEYHHLTSVDRLFVCSDWAKKVLEDEGVADEVERIDVIPLGVDPEVFYIDKEARAQRAYWTKHKTVFINVGKWEVRKGHNELLEAFSKAFKPDDPVELWMINQNDFIGLKNEEWKTRYIASPMGSAVKLLPRLQSQHEMRRIFNSVDFGVFPAHAEGWNLEPLELMACGIPSIVTNYSGHTQFCNDINSFLVQPNGMTAAHDSIGGRWFNGQGDWCTFDMEELVAQMRKAFELHQQELRNIRREGEPKYSGLLGRKTFECIKTAKEFSWENTAKKIVEAL